MTVIRKESAASRGGVEDECKRREKEMMGCLEGVQSSSLPLGEPEVSWSSELADCGSSYCV